MLSSRAASHRGRPHAVRRKPKRSNPSGSNPLRAYGRETAPNILILGMAPSFAGCRRNENLGKRQISVETKRGLGVDEEPYSRTVTIPDDGIAQGSAESGSFPGLIAVRAPSTPGTAPLGSATRGCSEIGEEGNSHRTPPAVGRGTCQSFAHDLRLVPLRLKFREVFGISNGWRRLP